ncbi:ATP-binding SpoIIE family protein phosphatase [Streptomyces sp. NPDC001941]|uniref:ATP-binding SpoIIE family protein phosphatase n=1 Tax=Streptomyces sp. NPDC001941 TaxID=3154659 RepID=UPI00332EE72F
MTSSAGDRNKRPGRPWGPARGDCVEVNKLVELVRSWLDEAAVSVQSLRRGLVPDHFRDATVPELRPLRDQLAGDGLTWDLVEAVEDVCFPGSRADVTAARLAPARALWERGRTSPTPAPGPPVAPPGGTRDLLAAQERTIAAYEEMARARQAYDTSERGRQQAVKAAALLLMALAQAQAKIAELNRRIDALTVLPAQEDFQQRLGVALERVRAQESALRGELARAEEERDLARRVADRAARRVAELERELAGAREGVPRSQLAVAPGGPDEDPELDELDDALGQLRGVLDEEGAAVRRAAHEMGLRDPSYSWPDEATAAYPDGADPGWLEADALQRSMLPASLPRSPGVEMAARYRAATEAARLGGDWFDVIPLPGSRVALMVGDVMGPSLAASAVMGQLRTTAQTLAGLDLPPHDVLFHLDEQAQRLGPERMATCVYAVYDPVSHRITLAGAGHPPPLLQHPDGRTEVLAVPPGAPIGVGGAAFEQVEFDAPPGSTLVLYTDGLVESRTLDVWAGIEDLCRVVGSTADEGPDGLCDATLQELGSGRLDDDIALLAARFSGIAATDVAYWSLESEATAAGRARRLVRRALERWGLDELTDTFALLVSEVVTNAVRYAERPVTLRLMRTDVLRCEVGDDWPGLPRLKRAMPLDEGNRGMFLVNRLSQRWGATRLSTGKVVWFEVRLPTGAERAPRSR